MSSGHPRTGINTRCEHKTTDDQQVTGTNICAIKRGLDVSIQSFPEHAGGAFGKLRVSNPYTLFDSKQTNDNQPLFWDDQETSGSGTTSIHSANHARSRLAVSATTAGTRVRQTFQKFNYQPGKSQLIVMTGVIGTGGSGITQRIGYFDGNNGLFFQVDDGTLSVVRRSNVTGTAVDEVVTQSNWSVDPLDGTGRSGITIDLTKTQIFFMDFEWLGVGRVRMGVFNEGLPRYVHHFVHANNLDVVYMSTPNLPLRYEISNDGTGAAASMDHICTSVMSEGGQQNIGTLRNESTGGTHINANTANTIYACIGYRLKTTHLDASIILVRATMLNIAGDDFEWMVIFNPTVAGTFTYSDKTNSAVQTAIGVTANTITGGTVLDSGFVKSSGSTGNVNISPTNALRVGAAIDGTRDELVFCVRPLTNGADIEASISWQEL